MALKNFSFVPIFEPTNLQLVMPCHCQLDVSNYVTIPEIILIRHKTGASCVGALVRERSSKHLLPQSKKVALHNRIITALAQRILFSVSGTE
jgi:hypothetical protein